MSLNAIGPRGDAAVRAISPGYRNALDGLRSFDTLSRTLGERRDRILRDVTRASAAYPKPATGSPSAASAFGAAVAGFAESDAGRAAIERAVSAAGSFLKGVFGSAETVAQQLPLPFE